LQKRTREAVFSRQLYREKLASLKTLWTPDSEISSVEVYTW